jgi:hypothetical protein
MFYIVRVIPDYRCRFSLRRAFGAWWQLTLLGRFSWLIKWVAL